MANYANLKSDIAGVIRTNNNEEITGDILQEQLLGMVDSLGAGFQYKGVATPTTAPGTPDENVFYIASTAGTYTNFGSLVVAEGEVAILKYNGSWAKEVTGAATAAQVTQLGQDVDTNKNNITNLQQEIDSIQPIIIEGNVTNAPDEEDITTDSNDLLKFADRSTAVNQMGYVILRKNKTFAEQVTKENTIYEIRYAFDLDGASVTIPAGCVLFFTGGSINGGSLIFTSTLLLGKTAITARFSGSLSNQIVETKWFNNDHVLQDVFSVSEGRVIEFESKEFQCAYSITIPSCVVHGNGATIRLLDTDEKSGEYESAFKITNKHFRSTTQQDEIDISNLHFVTKSIVGVHLCALSSTKNLHLSGCSFICEKPDVPDPTAITLHCFDLDGNDEDALFENCVFENHCDNGSTTDGNGGGVWIRAIVANKPSNNIIFRGCKIYNNCLDELFAVLTLYADINNIVMSDCDFEYERMATSLRNIEGTIHFSFKGSNTINGVLFDGCRYKSNYLPAKIFDGSSFTNGLVKNTDFVVDGYMYHYDYLNPTFNSNGMYYSDCSFSIDVENIAGNTQTSSKPTFSGRSQLYGCRVHLGNSRLFFSWATSLFVDSCSVDCEGALFETNAPSRIIGSRFVINLSAAGVALGMANQSDTTEWRNNSFVCVGFRGNANFPATDKVFTLVGNTFDNFLFSNYQRQELSGNMTPYGRGDLLKKPAYNPGDFTNGSVVAGDYFVVKGEIKLTSGLFLLANTTLDFTEGGKISGASTLWMDSTRILPEGCKISDFVTAPFRSQSGKVPYATGQVLYRNSRYEMWNGTAWVNLDGSALS